MRSHGAVLPAEGRKVADFESFFGSEYPGLVRTLYLLTGSLAEAEDIAQEALARAFERWPRVRTMDSPGGTCIERRST